MLLLVTVLLYLLCATQSDLDLVCPPELLADHTQLARPLAEEQRELQLVGHEVRVAAVHHVLQRDLHHLLNCCQPRLDRLVAVHCVQERHALAALTEYAVRHDDTFLLLHVELLHAVETLLHVWLHGERVARLREDLEELVVRQEVEARELAALALQVRLQLFLDLV